MILPRRLIPIAAGILSGAFFLPACSNDTYRRWADADVQKLLSDRKEKTLGYEPRTPINAPIPGGSVPKKAYAEIPQTPVVPTQPPPVEPSQTIVPYGTFGPETKWMRDWPAPQLASDMGMEAAQKQAAERLRQGPPSPFIVHIRLDLFGAMQYGIQHSRDYQSQLETLYLSALDVTLQRHLLLEPQPFVQANFNYEGHQGEGNGANGVDARSALAATVNAGVTQRLPFGGQVVASALVGFVDALNSESVNGESAQLALSGSIPLLRGAGLVNLEPLINTERQLVYQVRNFENYRRNFVVTVASQYFSLQTRQQSVTNRRYNYANSAAIATQTQALFAANRISFLEVQRAVQAQLQAQTSLITAQASYDAAVDNFKLILGMPVDQTVEIVPIALEIAVPDMADKEATALAEKYRLDLQTARDQIDDARRNVSNAENGLLPDLSLTAASSVSNRAGAPAKEIDARTLSYSAGLQLNLPIDRLAERNSYRTSLIVLAQAQRSLVDQTESVKADVRSSLRQIRAAQMNTQIQRRAVDLAQRRLEYSTLLLQLGQLTSNRDLVDAQSSLLTAQDSYEQAKSDLQVNVLSFLRTTGTLRVDPRAGSLGRVLNLTDQDVPTDVNPAGALVSDAAAMPSNKQPTRE